MITPPKATKAPDIQRKAIMDWTAGTVTSYDARRLIDNAMQSSSNVTLEQNGVLRPRPSMTLYGPQIASGKFLGQLFECKVMTNAKPTFYLLAMIVVEGVANVYYAKGSDTNWTKITGKTYNTTAPAHFVKLGGKVLVMNGVDNLSYVDTSNWTIVSYNALSQPAAPTITPSTSLTDGTTDQVIYYAITANSSVGETQGSTTISQNIDKDRGFWASDTDYCKVSWSAVQGATGYNVYMGTTTDGAGAPKLYLIQANIDPSVTSFTDDGTASVDVYRPLPTTNSTAGPKATRGTVVNGRVWLVGDTDNPYNVWYGGSVSGAELDFSPSENGGGHFALADGSDEVPIAVMPFRKGQGDSTVVVLTQGSNGSGKRYHVTYRTIELNGESVIAWEPTEDSGTDGTDSPDGVVIYNNSLYYPSRDGFKTTGTQPSLQNVLSTTRISNTIQDQVSLLNSTSMDKAVGLAYEGCIYWALPVGSTSNNRIFVFDIDHKGAWICSWYVKADWMMLYNDNSGITHFLILSDNKIYELSRRIQTRDDNKIFNTEAVSGQIAWSKDVRDWARLIQVVFTVTRPVGKINFEISAMTEDGEMAYRKELSSIISNGGRGWSEPTIPWSAPRAWSKVKYKEAAAIGDDVDVIIEVDEDAQWFSYRIWSTEAGVDYKLSSVVAEYVPIGIKDLS
ncbi:hypothetical protein IJI55_00855 [Candidatus Saccharibacteria bacterium]|nr:hypothetical protein [Candidatus Saccharibacteria bacterium]